MKIINAQQGTPEWAAHRAQHFNASDAPAMMGSSRYTTRTELLARLATGVVAEVSEAKQALFDRGHQSEAAARPIVEEMIGAELYPAVGVSDELPRLSASFDGITIDGATGYEHKLWSEALAEAVRTGAVADDPAYYWQLEHQIIVGNLERIIFTVSDGTPDRLETYTYTARPGRAAQLLAGWAQFEADLATHKPATAKAEVVAAPVETLPAIVYTIERGTMALTSNITEFRAAAEILVERTKVPLVTDQDFADREALCKAFGEAEKLLKMKAEEVVGQISDVAAFSRELGNIAEMFRAARLASEKLVEAEKKNRRAAIQQGGEQALAQHIAGLQARFGARVQMPPIRGDFALAIKGKRTLESIQNAVDTELAQRKIEASQAAELIATNLGAIDMLAPEHGFLFRDLQQLVAMPADAFRAVVECRVIAHKTQEETRLSAERARIAREERERIEREQQATERQKQESPAATDTSPQRGVEGVPGGVAVAASPGKAVTRPTDAEIIKVIADHFAVNEQTAAAWVASMRIAA